MHRSTLEADGWSTAFPPLLHTPTPPEVDPNTPTPDVDPDPPPPPEGDPGGTESPAGDPPSPQRAPQRVLH
jgi:hypothetical protein